jgi:cytochrome b pre-mRNA-processing protein 3
MIFSALFGKKKPDPSEALYGTIVAAARQPNFYANWAVPDTMNGRFDMLVLHMFLVHERLKAFGPEAEELAQSLTDRFFAQMDAALREVGVGDLAVGKKVRKMAEGYLGRALAYRRAMANGLRDLQEALARNVFANADAEHARALAEWTVAANAKLATQGLPAFQTGEITFQ